MEELVGQFLDYLQYERQRSKRTIGEYGDDLRAFCQYVESLDEDISWQTVDKDLVRNWMEHMMDKGNTATSVNRRLSALRSFFRFAKANGKVAANPTSLIRGPKKSKPLPQYLREEEMDRLLRAEYWNDSYRDFLARTIILTFYSTGIRLSELDGLDDSSIDYAQHQLKVLGKGNKERIIPFGRELEQVLKEYQILRDNITDSRSGALFVDEKGARLTNGKIRNEVIRNLSKVTTMRKRSPHVLRHTFATAMLNNEADLVSVQKLLGHESVATTEIYTHVTFEQLRKAYVKAHPRGDAE